MKKRKRLFVKPDYKTLIEHGVHIWAALFFANVILLYSFAYYFGGAGCNMQDQDSASQQLSVVCRIQKGTFFSTLLNPKSAVKAENKKIAQVPKINNNNIFQFDEEPPVNPEADISIDPELSPPDPTDIPKPPGPKISLIIKIPGVGSGSGQFKPLHKTRRFALLLYSPDVNTTLTETLPLYTVTGKVTYDENVYSSTYTSFINENFDLGPEVLEDYYQIVIVVEKSLAKLVKDNDEDIGGKLVSVDKYNVKQIPSQKVIIGDIAPSNKHDNIMDIKDYNLLANCFEGKAKSTDCPDKLAADLNDDGVVNGIDYNLMLHSFQSLLAMGYPVPTLAISPTPRPTIIQPSKKPVPSKTPTPSVAKVANTSSSGAGGLLFFMFVLVLGGGGFGLYKINPKFKAKVDKVIAKNVPLINKFIPKSAQKKSDTASTAAGDTGAAPATAESQQPNTPPDAAAPAVGDTKAAEGAVEGDYFVKKKSEDKEKGGCWLSLTGDNGLLEGFYKGNEVTDGFAKVKGTMKTEGGKTYVDITEIKPEE